MKYLKEIKKALLLTALLAVLLCALYPAAVTLVARVAFPGEQSGSMVTDRDGNITGSALIGQPFSDQVYFWSRPSATASTGSMPDDPLASGGSNLGPTNPALLDEIQGNAVRYHAAGLSDIPQDLVTSSASGLDPDITLEAAMAQAPRVAAARGLPLEQVINTINDRKQSRWLGVLGTERVNVLLLNLDLDAGRGCG